MLGPSHRTIAILSAFLLAGWAFTTAAFACRYNVRDVGFVDLSRGTAYQLDIYIDDSIPEETVTAFEQIAYAALLDTNIEAQVVSLEEMSEGTASELHDKHGLTDVPAVVLSSPAGTSLEFTVSSNEDSPKNALWDVLDSIAASPIRETILQKIVDSYGVVLLVEGTNAEENAKAAEAAEESIGRIAAVLDQLPKVIDEPPQLMRLPHASTERERVLLWSLGVPSIPPSEPYVAVLYGRGRRMGPVLSGRKLNQSTIYSVLSVIGLSCECGLDRSWIQGTMLPFRWDTEKEKEAADHLGFDPESPVVKMEISQILSMGSGNGSASQAPGLGYRESIVQLEANTTKTLTQPQSAPTILEEEPNDRGTPLDGVILLMIVLTVAAVGGGTLILLRAKLKS